jgi:hypothetical protein
MAAPVAGANTPSRIPAVIAISTWAYRERKIERCNFIARQKPPPHIRTPIEESSEVAAVVRAEDRGGTKRGHAAGSHTNLP